MPQKVISTNQKYFFGHPLLKMSKALKVLPAHKLYFLTNCVNMQSVNWKSRKN